MVGAFACRGDGVSMIERRMAKCRGIVWCQKLQRVSRAIVACSKPRITRSPTLYHRVIVEMSRIENAGACEQITIVEAVADAAMLCQRSAGEMRAVIERLMRRADDAWR